MATGMTTCGQVYKSADERPDHQMEIGKPWMVLVYAICC